MNEAKLREAIYRCFSEVTKASGRELIRSDQDGTRPNPPFATYRMDINEINDFNEERYNFTDASIENITRTMITVSLQYYGKFAFGNLSSAREQFRLRSFRDKWHTYFNEQGLCIDLNDIGNVTNLSQLLESNFEQRAQLDVMFSSADVIIDRGYCEDNMNFEITSFNVTGEIKKHPGDDEPITKNFDIIEG